MRGVEGERCLERRKEVERRSSSERSAAIAADLALAGSALRCAVCRTAALELTLAADIVSEAAHGGLSEGQRAMLWVAPSVLCEHMGSIGLLGHSTRVLHWARPVCEAATTRGGPDEARRLRWMVLEVATSVALLTNGTLAALMCDGFCEANEQRLGGEEGTPAAFTQLEGWPALLQLLLDSVGEPLQHSLRHTLAASRPQKGNRRRRSTKRQPERERWRAGGGIAEALLLFGASRSDTTAVKIACALGVCGRVGRAPPDSGAMVNALLEATPTERLVSVLAPSLSEPAPLREAAQWLRQLHWVDHAAAGAAGHGGASARDGWMSAVHVAAFTLDEELVRVMLIADPSAAFHTDTRGRTPLHYAAAGADRLLMLVYMFSEQPFRTWLRLRSASALRHAPPVTQATLIEELEDAAAATLRQVLRAVARAGAIAERSSQAVDQLVVAADRMGRTAMHFAAAGGSVMQMGILLCAVTPAERHALLERRDIDGLDAISLAAAAGHSRASRWLIDAAKAEAWPACEGGDARAANPYATSAHVNEADSRPMNDSQALAAAQAHAEAVVAQAAAATRDDIGRCMDNTPPALRQDIDVCDPETGAHPLSDKPAPGLDRGTGNTEASVGGLCDLEVISASQPDALRRAALLGRPVLVRDGAADWPARGAPLTRDELLSVLGDFEWQPQLLLRGSNTTRKFRRRSKIDRSLRAYLKDAAGYARPLLFNRPRDVEAIRILTSMVGEPPHVVPPEWREVGGNAGSTGFDAFVGPAGSGVPMHWHGPVWNALVFGRKLWAFMPPDRSRFAPEGQHSLDSDWVGDLRRAARRTADVHDTLEAEMLAGMRARGGRNGAPGHRAFEMAHKTLLCVQDAQDVILVPSGWGHSTVFLNEGMGIGGFLQQRDSLGLHMQVLHAPRGIGSLQTAATIHEPWRQSVGPAFS